MSYFIKLRGEENLSSNLFNKSFVYLIFEQGQCISVHARVLSIVINGVGEAVTGGSLREKLFLETYSQALIFNSIFIG